MKILFHRHTEWQGAIRCSTNIFAKLAIEAGHEIVYMHGMVHLGNLIFRKGRFASWKKGFRRENGAYVFTPLSLVPFSQFRPFDSLWAAQKSYSTSIPTIKSQLDSINFTPDVIWSANPGSTSLKKIYPRAKFIFQVVDYYPAFSGDSIKSIEREDYKNADHIFVIGETLKQYLTNEYALSDQKITVLGQGVFSKAYSDNCKPPADLINLPRPIATWVGVMSKCDKEMMYEVARVLGNIGGTLLLIGPQSDWEKKLLELNDNVRILGSKKPDEVPSYLLHSDIGLMLYDQSRQSIYEGQNPLKLYEYSAAGLPILSTPHKEYEYINPPVIEIKQSKDIEQAIKFALENRESLRLKSKRFIENRDWNSIYDVAESRLTDS